MPSLNLLPIALTPRTSSSRPEPRFGYNAKNPPKPSEYEIKLTPDMMSSEDGFQLRPPVLCQMKDMLMRVARPTPQAPQPETHWAKLGRWLRREQPEKPFNRTHGFVTIPNLATMWSSPKQWEQFASQLNYALLSVLNPEYGTANTQYHPYAHLLDGASVRHRKNTVGYANLHRDGDAVTPIPHLVLLYHPAQHIQPKSGALLLADTLHFCHQNNHPPLQSFDLHEAAYRKIELSHAAVRRIKSQYVYELPWDHDQPLLVVVANRAESGIFHAGAPFKGTGTGTPVRNLFRAAAIQENSP